MGLIARFWNWLTASAIAQPRKGHPDLYPIDIDKLAKELNLVVEAKRLGEVSSFAWYLRAAHNRAMNQVAAPLCLLQ